MSVLFGFSEERISTVVVQVRRLEALAIYFLSDKIAVKAIADFLVFFGTDITEYAMFG